MKPKMAYLRDMDPEVWQRARIAALKKGKTTTAWITEAIRTKLRKENG